MKLTETQLVLLSKASQRQDHAVDLPANLNGSAARKVVGATHRRPARRNQGARRPCPTASINVGGTVRRSAWLKLPRVALMIALIEACCKSRSNNPSLKRPIGTAAPETNCGS